MAPEKAACRKRKWSKTGSLSLLSCLAGRRLDASPQAYDLWEMQMMARRTSDRPLYSKLAGLYMQTELTYLQNTGVFHRYIEREKKYCDVIVTATLAYLRWQLADLINC